MLYDLKNLIDKLYQESYLNFQEITFLLENLDEENKKYLFQKSYSRRLENYGNTVFLRGLVEISSYCKMDCDYCGIRRSNRNAQRYRLTPEEILECCLKGYHLGFRTFVLQGGVDLWFTDEKLISIIAKIRENCPDAAITLSLGERTAESYQKLYLQELTDTF